MNPEAKLPPKILPLLYLGTAHVSLAFACVVAGWWPRAVAGFFYHSWMVAIVHLVTLGWITLSILGAIYIVGPVALGMPMPARRADYAAYAFAIVGIVGMIAHFWIQEFGGMAWSAATVTTGIVYVALRILQGLRGALAPPAVKLHLAFACVNVMIAASAGILLGVDKVHPFLPGFVLSNVFAHAHLAALGWATMMVVGVGYRLMPMVLPARPASGRSLYASAMLLEAGVLLLFAGLILTGLRLTPHLAQAGAVLIVAAISVAAAHVIGMVRHPRPKPTGAPDVDFAVLHAAASGVSLAVACGLGLYLSFAPASDASLRIALAYGVFGLVGFLAQMVVAMEARLLPMFAWYRGFAATGFRDPVPSPHALHDRSLQQVAFVGWIFGVPALAVGLAMPAVPLVAAGAWALFTAVVVSAIDSVIVFSRASGSRREPVTPAMPVESSFLRSR